MFNNDNINNELVITENKLGSGSFGNVYLCYNKNSGQKYAIKIEKKDNNNSLLKEFKISMKLYNIQKYIKTNGEYMNSHPTIQIYNYIVKNDILSIPKQLSMDLILHENIIPKPETYYDAQEYNFLTMDLCGNNFEYIIKNYTLTEECKYFIAYKLLHIMACFHRTGIIHRDIKLSNIVLNKKIEETKNINDLYIVLIDMGLSKEFYTYEGEQVILVKNKKLSSITGTIRYLSLNVHAFNSPSVVDDLIGLCYVLINIMTQKNLPWVGHKKDDKKFNFEKHTTTNCKCGFHKNLKNNNIKGNNTISEIKYHMDLNILCGNYTFLKEWLEYLYSLGKKQMPSYNILFHILQKYSTNLKNLKLDFIKNN